MFALTAYQQEIVERATEDAAILRQGAAHADLTRSFPPASLHTLRRNYSLLIPGHHTETTMVNYALVMSELAKGDASAALGLCMHHFAMGEISRSTVPAGTQKIYHELGREHLFSALVSEPGSSSSNVASFVPSDVTVVLKNGKWVLNGKKHFASFFGISDFAMIFAHRKNTASTVACLIVPTKGTGIKIEDIWHTHGMRATQSNVVHFNNVQLDQAALLYETTDYLATAVFEGGVRTFGYMAVYQGIGERLLELASQSLGNRVAKGTTQPLGSDPSIAETVGDCAGRLHASRLVMLDAMSSFDTLGPSPETLQRIFMAKQIIGQTVDSVAGALRLRMGAHGLLGAESPMSKDDGEFERLLRDAATAGIMPPSTTSCQRELGYMLMNIAPSQRPS